MPFRFTLVILGCLLAGSAQARLGALPPEAPRHVAARDLTAIERTGELRVLVNQSRHSSGEWNGQALGIEYRRLEAFARSGLFDATEDYGPALTEDQLFNVAYAPPKVDQDEVATATGCNWPGCCATSARTCSSRPCWCCAPSTGL